MATVAVTDETFDSEVKNSDVPVVVDFGRNGVARASKSVRRWKSCRLKWPAN